MHCFRIECVMWKWCHVKERRGSNEAADDDCSCRCWGLFTSSFFFLLPLYSGDLQKTALTRKTQMPMLLLGCRVNYCWLTLKRMSVCREGSDPNQRCPVGPAQPPRRSPPLQSRFTLLITPPPPPPPPWQICQHAPSIIYAVKTALRNLCADVCSSIQLALSFRVLSDKQPQIRSLRRLHGRGSS